MVKWELPSEDRRGRPEGTGRWIDIANALKENPGEWALVAEDAWVQSARQSLLSRGCEITCRGVNKPVAGKAEKIYARYVEETEEF